MDKSFLETKEVNQAMDTLKYISADDEMRAIADLRQKTINDRNSEMTVAREEGLAEGKAEGKAEGIAIGEERGELKKARETALSMLADRVPKSSICKYTGLSIQDIENLRKEK